MIQGDDTLKQRILDLQAYCKQCRIEQQSMLTRKEKLRSYLRRLLRKVTIRNEQVRTSQAAAKPVK